MSGSLIDVPGKGQCLLPSEFAAFTGPLGTVETHSATAYPRGLLERLASGAAVLLYGPYPHVDAVMRYCHRYERGLVDPRAFDDVPAGARRSAAFADARRRKLHHMLVLARGDALVGVDGAPETPGLQEWLESPTGDTPFLMPFRRFQRIVTDMRRASAGIPIDFLDGTITIRPHVYVPADLSVPRMFERYGETIAGKTVLDVGTGTGILAIIAARLGARSVTAVDSNPKAVENARLNAERFGLGGIVEVADAGDLFAPVSGREFDVIIFNAPWIEGQPRTLYDTANYDPGFSVIDAFMRDAPGHLAAGGVILLQYSNISQRTGADSLGHLSEIIALNGLKTVSTHTIGRLSRALGAQEKVHLFEIRKA